MKAFNVILIFLGCWFFLSGGNLDDRVLSSIQLYSAMLVILLFFAICVFFSGISFHIGMLLFPAFFLYIYLVNLFFGGGGGSVVKVVVFTLVVMMACFIANKLTVIEFVETLVIALFLLLIANIVVSSFFPGIGLELGKFRGDWKGIFDQKNALGRLSSLLIASSILLMLCSKDKSVRIYTGLVLISAVMVAINAGSRTGLATGVLVALLSILFYLVYYVLNDNFVHKKVFVMLLFLEMLLCFYLVISNMEVVDLYTNEDGVSIFGNFFSLTGRLTIWDFVIEHAKGVHFWFGYGLDNFWTFERFSLIGPMEGMGDFYPEDSHNGYIDVLVQGGGIGIALYLSIFILLIKSLFGSKLSFAEYATAFTFIMLFLFSNLTESYTTKSTNIVNFLFVYSVAVLLLRSAPLHAKGVITIQPFAYAKKLYISGVARK
ncbi:O-antigen ligase family protein [Halomonas sp. AOP12-C2-37]|uniref:O-antigen ligase family protein n=1 Tax=unclassified Halomonas TaxID=2609666 RepID=UPI0040348F0A